MCFANGFNPLTALLRAQPERPPELAAVNLRVLTAFQRALLVIDGTVTKFIEAYVMEPVDIRRLAQERSVLPADHSWLDARAGTELSIRQVLIEGRYSRRAYVYAVSLVVLERLPAHARALLDAAGAGIGRVLGEAAMETRREILWYGREHARDVPEDVARRTGGEFVSRTYRIIAGGRPIALINEKFPLEIDRQPAHE